MDTEAYWIAFMVGAAVLLFNGFAELIGGSIKESGNKWEYKKYATALIKIIIGFVFVIIAAAFITCSR